MELREKGPKESDGRVFIGEDPDHPLPPSDLFIHSVAQSLLGDLQGAIITLNKFLQYLSVFSKEACQLSLYHTLSPKDVGRELRYKYGTREIGVMDWFKTVFNMDSEPSNSQIYSSRFFILKLNTYLSIQDVYSLINGPH